MITFDVVIKYNRKDYSRDQAWRHLQNNVPTIEFAGKELVPVFRTHPLSGGKQHPYRKSHGAEHWGYSVENWEENK